MTITRRQFLVSSSSAGAFVALSTVGCNGKRPQDTGVSDTASPEGASLRSPEPHRWQPVSDIDYSDFPYGVQVGDSRSESVVVTCRNTISDVVLVLMVQSASFDGDTSASGENWDLVGEFAATTGVGGVCRWELDELIPDTAYCLAVFSGDNSSRSSVTRFRTALGADEMRVVTIGSVSCLGGNLPWPSLSVAGQEDLDLFCMLGDTVYADGALTLEEYRAFWLTAFSQKGLLDLTSSTSIVSTWDDHEVGNDWSLDSISPDKLNNAYTAFREAMPIKDGGGRFKIWRKLEWGKTIDLFVLDCRGERTGENYISVEQMDWLKDGLSNSTARFKVILNSVPITDLSAIVGDALAGDRWQGYGVQREEILSHVEDSHIDGVLWVSGDVHYGQVGRVSTEGEVGDTQWEVFTGPGGSRINPVAQLFEGDPQYVEMIPEWNWVRFRFDPLLGVVTVTFVSDSGSDIYSQDLYL